MRVPVFGDIHGNLEGMANTIRFLQDRDGEQYSHAIQLGDFGYFPGKPPEKTRSDLEFGVHNYIKNPEDNNYLEDLDISIIFIKGNHENNHALRCAEEFYKEGMIRVEQSQKILYLPNGRVISLGEQGRLVGALGGINQFSRPKSYSKDSGIAYKDKEIDSLLDFENLDILITHQGPEKTAKGDSTINTLCEIIHPKIHLHGHSHKPQGPNRIENTRSYGLAKMPESKRPYLENNDFYGVLDLEDMNFEFRSQQP